MTELLRYLNIAAHPDDLDFGCAGTTASLTSAGHDVVYCVVTDGQAGGSDRAVSRDQMARLRREEQAAAAKVVGVSELHFLGFEDGVLEVTLELRRALARVIRQVRPDRVISQSPARSFERVYASHPDHLATGEATLCAVYPDARNPFAFPELLADEGLEPHIVNEVWLMGGPDPDLTIDVTATIDRKIEALLCHESQMQDPERLPAMIRGWGRSQAASGGLGEGRMAERFRRIETS
jgi:LmbE family N-acetylglucosaminyl deacetylase